jgi:2-polyprenyl-3-methyl-5-hydroxy-6-metoxy-1,4-benzoquinol methylase
MTNDRQRPDADEETLQEGFTWARSVNFATYNEMLARYQAQACLEHARGTSLLDMPCGDGLLTAIMAPRFSDVVGVDASSAHLVAARTRLPRAEFHHSLIEELTLDRRFDTVSMLNVLEHVVDPTAVLRKAASFLNPDGLVIVHVPNAEAVNRKIAVLMGTLESCEELSPFDIEVAGHRRSYNLDSLCADLAASDLRVVATGGVFYKMLSTPQIEWFLSHGPWKEGGFGWGRVGADDRDWREEFGRACYEFGKDHPEDCNIIYACAVPA